MPALIAGIHVLLSCFGNKDVDGRAKPGHDGWENRMNYWLVKSEPSSW